MKRLLGSGALVAAATLLYLWAGDGPGRQPKTAPVEASAGSNHAGTSHKRLKIQGSGYQMETTESLDAVRDLAAALSAATNAPVSAELPDRDSLAFPKLDPGTLEMTLSRFNSKGPDSRETDHVLTLEEISAAYQAFVGSRDRPHRPCRQSADANDPPLYCYQVLDAKGAPTGYTLQLDPAKSQGKKLGFVLSKLAPQAALAYDDARETITVKGLPPDLLQAKLYELDEDLGDREIWTHEIVHAHMHALSFEEHSAYLREHLNAALGADSVHIATVGSTCYRFLAQRKTAAEYVAERIGAALGEPVSFQYDSANQVMRVKNVPLKRLADALDRIDRSEGEYPDCFLSPAELNSGLHPTYPRR